MRLPIVVIAGLLLVSDLAFPPLTAQLPAQTAGVRDGQPPAKPGGIRVTGRVLAADTGRPIHNAIVSANVAGAGAQPTSTSTGADGRWEIRDLIAASYTISIAKAGYVTMKYGQRRPDLGLAVVGGLVQAAKVLDLKDGQVLEGIDLNLPRAGAIAGRLSDEFGEPVTGAIVSAMRYGYVDGQRRLVPVGGGGIGSVLIGGLADDLGQFRIYGLPAGDYLVSATLADSGYVGQGDARTSYVPTYYPGTASPTEAQRVTLVAGQEALGISFSLSRIHVSTISGRVIDSAGNPLVRPSLSLTAVVGRQTSPSGGFSLNYANQGTSRPDGAFTLLNIPPGEYLLQAQSSTGGGGGRGGGPGTVVPPLGRGAALAEPELGWLPVTVAGQDVTNLTVVTARGVTAAGRVLVDGNPSSAVNGVSIRAIPAVPGAYNLLPPNGSSRVLPNGSFELQGLLSRRLFRIRATDDWFLKSVTVEGKDVTDTGYDFVTGQNVTGIEIVLTQRTTTLSGTAQDERGNPISDYAVVAFSTDSRKWGYESRFARSVASDQDGKFLLKGLPSDDYFVVALPYAEPGEETDPVQLEKWKSRAIRITLTDTETKSLALQLSR